MKSDVICYEEDTDDDVNGRDLHKGHELKEWGTSIYAHWNVKVLINTWKITQGGHLKFNIALKY